MQYDDVASSAKKWGFGVVVGLGFLTLISLYFIYTRFRIDVPSKHFAVLTKKTGQNLDNSMEVAPDATYKGLQKEVLTEGRYFYNPFTWDWDVQPMIEVPAGKLGVRVRLHGDDLPYGHFVAEKENQKGIVAEVLNPGRYAINAIIRGDKSRYTSNYLEIIELHDPVTITAGYKGIVTNLSGPMPEDPNQILVEVGKRGVQAKVLDEGTYYINPYTTRINEVDCRSQRFNIGENYDMGFPSLDGFWVSLDGIIEFRVKPDHAAEVYVIYNETNNDQTHAERVDDEIVKKIILPNARSFCRIRGSNSTGREFIGGDTRIKFQEEFQVAMREACEPLGIEIIQALITKINPPQAIAGPVRDREVSHQKLRQYTQQMKQQDAEVKLAIEQQLITQKKKLVEADEEVVKLTVSEKKKQQVAVIKAEERLASAQFKLDAAKDQAEAILAEGRASAEVQKFENQAAAAGWKKAVEAFGGDGEAYARYVMFQKLSPGYKSIMINTADSPLMEVFQSMKTKQHTPLRPTAVPAN